MKNGCEPTKNGIQPNLQLLSYLNEAKWLCQNDVSKELEPSLLQNSTNVHGNPKYSHQIISIVCK